MNRDCRRWRFVCYFRLPRFRFLRRVCRSFALLRLGLVITNVPLPKFSDL